MHVEPPLIPLTKINNDEKSDKYCVKIKFRRYHTSEKSDLHEFKMALFDNGDPDEFLFFVRNFQMALKASVMLTASANIQYLCMLVCGEALRQLDMLSFEVVGTTSENLKLVILGLGAYFFPLMRCQKK